MRVFAIVALAAAFVASGSAAKAFGLLPDGRSVTPTGFTIPVEGFATSAAMSPDGQWIAVLSQDGNAIDVIATGEDARQVDRLAAPFASGMTWTNDGLYVTRGFTGMISRYRYDSAASVDGPAFTKRADLHIGGLLNGIVEDPATHRIIVARTALQEVDVVSDTSGAELGHLNASGQPFSVGMSGGRIIATLYDSDHIDVWSGGAATPVRIQTGAHPTALLIAGQSAFVANADGSDVAEIGLPTLAVTRRFDLSLSPLPSTGQTPSGMAVSADGHDLFVAESGFDDVAVLDRASGQLLGRIPTGWYPMAVISKTSSTIDDDPRPKQQLWIVSAQGLGTQADPGSEWNGWYTGFLQHLVFEPARLPEWTAQVAADNHFAVAQPTTDQLPPIKHVLFIVRENKHVDEEFGDEPTANADPALLLYGRHFTPNAHALAERYTLFDDFMGNGQASIYGHSWTTQGMVNDYHVRNAHTPDDPALKTDRRVPYSIWPYAEMGEDRVSVATMNFDWYKDRSELPSGPRVDVSAIFGPKGELIDGFQRKGLSYRVYGEQMTVVRGGNIAPGLAANADREYPGAHIDFAVSDTHRAELFLADVKAHGLAAYSYLTLPTDHTAGTKSGFYTPASYVANNDEALGRIIDGLSHMPEWRDTIVFVTTDDPQGSGDHVDSPRQPAFVMGPYVRKSFIDHTHYSIPSILRTVEVLFGIDPLNMNDAAAPPMLDAFSMTPDVETYTTIPANIPMTKNPGKATSMAFMLDGPGSALIPDQEWLSIKGDASLAVHLAYLRQLGFVRVAETRDDRETEGKR